MNCKACHREFSSKSKLRLHFRSHNGQKPYQCKHCGKKFSLAGNLKVHKSRLHRRERPFLCKDCGKSFGYQSHFKDHVKGHFLGQLEEELQHQYECNTCGKTLETKILLTEHMKAHTGIFECHFCGKRFSAKKGVRRHIVKEVCQQTKPGKSKRRTDITICSVCGKPIVRYLMGKHLNTHMRNRMYPCAICGHVFLEASHRTVHVRTHTGVQPYECGFCGKRFSQRGNLKTHLKRKHEESSNEKQTGGQEDSGRGHQKSAVIKPEGAVLAKETRKEGVTESPEEHKKNDENRAKTPIGCQNLLDFLRMAENWLAENEPSVLENASQNQVSVLQIPAGDVPRIDDQVTLNSPSTCLSPIQNEPIVVQNERLTEGRSETENQVNSERHVQLSSKSQTGDNQVNSKPEETLSPEPGKLGKTQPSMTKKIKLDIWERLFAEIKESKEVQDILPNLTTDGDKTLLLLHRLTTIPPNNIVQEAGTKWNCWVCPAFFSARHGLVRHLITHQETKPFQCSLCSKRFSQSGNLQTHLLSHEGTQRRFNCALCGGQFRNKNEIRRHLEKAHEIADPPPKDHLCAEEQKFLCDVCGDRFRTKSLHSRHVKTHIERHVCIKCQKVYTDSSSLKRHILTHSGEKYWCHCMKGFTQTSSLRRHQLVCGKVVTKGFLCDFCGKGFPDQQQLKRHENTHTGQNKFQCPECDLVLKTKETLMRHTRRKHEK